MTNATPNNPWTTAADKKTPYVTRTNSEKKTTGRRLYVTASLILTPILLIALAVMVFDTVTGTTEPAPQASHMSDSDVTGRALAQRSLTAWLEQTPAPLPSGQLVSWDRVVRIPTPNPATSTTAKYDTYPVDVHTFTVVATSTEQLFHADVSIVVTPAGPVVQGTPSLEPYVPVSTSNTIPTWPNTTRPEGIDRDDVQASVQAWAEAYMSGDSTRLRQTVGDSDPTHTYIPMPPGFVKATISDMGVLTPAGDGDLDDRVIARVQLAVTWPVDDDSQARPAPAMTFDLLVDHATTASPKVVAWGGAGSGPSLQPYGNAVSGVEVKSDSSQSPTQPESDTTPEDTPVPEDTATDTTPQSDTPNTSRPL